MGARCGSRTRLSGLEDQHLCRSVNRASERPPGIEPGPSRWQRGMQPRTPQARWRRERESNPHDGGCSSGPCLSDISSLEGSGRNRTCATVVGFRLATGPRYRSSTLPRCARQELNLVSPACRAGVLPVDHARGRRWRCSPAAAPASSLGSPPSVSVAGVEPASSGPPDRRLSTKPSRCELYRKAISCIGAGGGARTRGARLMRAPRPPRARRLRTPERS
jgi:hypothetical protein